MYLPYIIKKLRKKNAARPAARPEREKAASRTPGSATGRVFTEFFGITDPETTAASTPAEKKSKRRKNKANSSPVLPEEGVRAVADMPPMQDIEEHPRATGARRDLRRAYLLGEILQRKF